MDRPIQLPEIIIVEPIYYDPNEVDEEPEDENEFFWFHKAAEQGDARAQCNLGCLYEENSQDNENIEEAEFWYSKSAEQDYAPALYHLGRYYMEWFSRINVEIDYYKQAEILFSQAAQQDYVKAQSYLGYLYETGCVDGWDNEAVYWYLKAAEQGYAKAQLALGHQFRYAYHHNEYGIEQDFKKAAFWYQRAAEQGHPSAQEELTKLGINWQES